MFRAHKYIRELIEPGSARFGSAPKAPVVIWNLTRRCNLFCSHCYTNSSDHNFPGELTSEQAFSTLDDLYESGVRILILSGGEPLLRKDIWEVAAKAKAMGFYLALSSNGTLFNPDNVGQIKEVGFDYVGISVDGIGPVHDKFRGRVGCFDDAVRGLRLCVENDLRAGLRFTLVHKNFHQLEDLVALSRSIGVDRFYLSHLNYSGRGKRNRGEDAHMRMTREALTYLFNHCRREIEAGRKFEFVTGNNDADAVFFLKWVETHFPDKVEHMYEKLQQWGGNATGRDIANIDPVGKVHPDSFWSSYTVGNIKKDSFQSIWFETKDELLLQLRKKQRPLKGRCGACPFVSVCNGNTRIRAYQTAGDLWAEDPGCYLTDFELGIQSECDPDTTTNIRGPELGKTCITEREEQEVL